MCVYTYGPIFMYISLQRSCANLITTYCWKSGLQETWK